jgi:hypothetical protein
LSQRQLEVCARFIQPNVYTLPPTIIGLGVTLLCWSSFASVALWLGVTMLVTIVAVGLPSLFLADSLSWSRFVGQVGSEVKVYSGC